VLLLHNPGESRTKEQVAMKTTKISLNPVSPKITTIRAAGIEIVFSYSTPVCAWVNGKSFKTDRFYSRTTSKHISEMGFKNATERPQEFFDDLAKQVGFASYEASNITSVRLPHAEIIFSYSTPVCAWVFGHGQVRTDRYFSNTTSKHIGKMGFKNAEKRPQEFFDALLEIAEPETAAA